MRNADMHRLWVDDITTIKGTDSIAVNVGKDLNLTGAAILSDNLVLAVSGNINKKELNDSYYSESMSIGLSTNFTTNGSQPTVTGSGGQPNQFPGGSTSISGSYAQNESNRTVYATIGGLDSILTSSTKDVTGGDFEGSLTIDHRLFSESGRNDILKQLNYSKNLAITPFTAASGAYSSAEDNKTEKFFQAVAGATIANTRLLLNQDITAQQLAGDVNLLAYEGDILNIDSEAKTRNAFYDSNTNTAAINSSSTDGINIEQIAGLIGHEAIGHKIGGGSEFVAGFVENTINDNWSIYQSGNTNFQLTLPQSNIYNNNYASLLNFNNNNGVYSNTVMVGGAGNESETKIYMTQWEEKFKKAGVVEPEYVPISFGGKGTNIINAAINRTGNIPFILPDDLIRYVPVSNIVNASNDNGGQRNIVGYSYGSVMGAYGALKLADQGIYVDRLTPNIIF